MLHRSGEPLIQQSPSEVCKVSLCSHRQLSRSSHHLLNSLLQQLPMSQLGIWGQFLAVTLLGKACKCLVVSRSFVRPLLGSTEAEGSWMLPTSDTAHESAQHEHVSVSHFLQCYLRGDGIKAPFLSELCKITSGMKIGGQFISVAGRTDFLIRSKL